QLTLAERERGPALHHLRVVSARQALDELMGTHLAGGPLEAGAVQLRVPQAQVAVDGSGEEEDVLQDQADVAAVRAYVHARERPPAHPDEPALRLVEKQERVD